MNKYTFDDEFNKNLEESINKVAMSHLLQELIVEIEELFLDNVWVKSNFEKEELDKYSNLKIDINLDNLLSKYIEYASILDNNAYSVEQIYTLFDEKKQLDYKLKYMSSIKNKLLSQFDIAGVVGVSDEIMKLKNDLKDCEFKLGYLKESLVSSIDSFNKNYVVLLGDILNKKLKKDANFDRVKSEYGKNVVMHFLMNKFIDIIKLNFNNIDKSKVKDAITNSELLNSLFSNSIIDIIAKF